MQVGDLVRYSYTLSVPTAGNQKFETLGVVMREPANYSEGYHAFILLSGQSTPTWVKMKYLEVVNRASR